MREITQVELYVDGGSRGNPGPAACAFIIREAEGRTIESRGFFLGKATNNVAEYSGLVRGLQAAREFGAKELHIFSDSELMVRQIIGEYRVKSPDLADLYREVQRLLLGFDRWQIKHVRRELNSEADRLVNKTLDDHSNGSEEPDTEVELSDGESLTAEPGNTPENSVKILVEVVSTPGSGACPAAMKKGQCFVFSEFVPAGLCIHAAQSLLPTILAMQQDPSFRGNGLMVKCSHPGCSAGFKLSII